MEIITEDKSYIVCINSKNKKRILALLNIPHDSVSSLCSMPPNCSSRLKNKTEQFDRQKSWNTFPNDSCVAATAPTATASARSQEKDADKIPLLMNGGSSVRASPVRQPEDNHFGSFRGGKRCSEGDITRDTCLVPLLSNGTSCNLVNERKLTITDF